MVQSASDSCKSVMVSCCFEIVSRCCWMTWKSCSRTEARVGVLMPSTRADPVLLEHDGAHGRGRTGYLSHTKGVLYHLSYVGMVGTEGVEPSRAVPAAF